MERLGTLQGVVVAGEQRGRTLGFPTANVTPDRDAEAPAHGVYAGRATRLDSGEQWWAAVSVGMRPTFDSALGELVEAYLLDFDGDLYGARLRLDFLARLRGEIRFESADELVAQMERDVADVRQIAAGAGGNDCGALQPPCRRVNRGLE
jgi:riboflavin kinase/FMN adenylyltransferase